MDHTPTVLPLPSNGTAESDMAADRATRSASRQRSQVLAYIVQQGEYGATRDEISDGLGLDDNSVRPRVWELLGNGGHPALIRRSGQHRSNYRGNKVSVLIGNRGLPPCVSAQSSLTSGNTGCTGV